MSGIATSTLTKMSANQPSNDSGITPIEYRVLLYPDVSEKVTAGGIVIPDTISERHQMAEIKATVVALGAKAFDEMDAGIQPGDRVIIAKYAGIIVEGQNGKQYRLCNDKEVVAKIEW